MSDPNYWPADEKPATADTFASRAALLGIASRRYGQTTLPRSGLAVRFQSLTDGEFSDFEDAPYDRDDDNKLTIDKDLTRNVRARLIVLTAVDEGNVLLFTPADVPAVTRMDMDDSLHLFDAIREHIGLTRTIQRRKAREERMKKLTRDGRRRFLYRLAAHLGIWDVFGLLRSISPEQVDEWIAFDELEPVGNEKLYAMLALHGANLAAAQGMDIPPPRFYPDNADDDDEPLSNAEFEARFSRFSERQD